MWRVPERGARVPLSSVAEFQKSSAPLVVNHQLQFPAITISCNLRPGASIRTGRGKNPEGGCQYASP